MLQIEIFGGGRVDFLVPIKFEDFNDGRNAF